jgi:hypothetical protein
MGDCQFSRRAEIHLTRIICGDKIHSKTLSLYGGCLRKIFVPKREEVTGGWRRLHNEQLHNLYAYKIKEDEISGHAARIEK